MATTTKKKSDSEIVKTLRRTSKNVADQLEKGQRMMGASRKKATAVDKHGNPVDGAEILASTRRTRKQPKNPEEVFTWRDLAICALGATLFITYVWVLWLARY